MNARAHLVITISIILLISQLCLLNNNSNPRGRRNEEREQGTDREVWSQSTSGVRSGSQPWGAALVSPKPPLGSGQVPNPGVPRAGFQKSALL